MPLLDHFHPPVNQRRPWAGFHSRWAGNIATLLNASIPTGYFAQPGVHFRIEVDMAALDEAGEEWAGQTDAGRRWLRTAPTATIPFAPITDEVEVQVFETSGGLTLVGALEIVSPANKDRLVQRDAFAAKCESYLRAGIGLIVVDIVTDRLADLHSELLARLDRGGGGRPGDPGLLSATSYRPTSARLGFWRELLDIARPLPDLPLWLKGGPCLTVELEAAYQEARANLNYPPSW